MAQLGYIFKYIFTKTIKIILNIIKKYYINTNIENIIFLFNNYKNSGCYNMKSNVIKNGIENNIKKPKKYFRPAISSSVFNSLTLLKARLQKELNLEDTLTWDGFFMIIDTVATTKFNEIVEIGKNLIEGKIEEYLI